jgi:hypothetical protein
VHGKAYIFFTPTGLLVIATITFERLITFQITNKTSLHCLGKANKQNKRIRNLTTRALQQFNETGYSKEEAIKPTNRNLGNEASRRPWVSSERHGVRIRQLNNKRRIIRLSRRSPTSGILSARRKHNCSYNKHGNKPVPCAPAKRSA